MALNCFVKSLNSSSQAWKTYMDYKHDFLPIFDVFFFPLSWLYLLFFLIWVLTQCEAPQISWVLEREQNTAKSSMRFLLSVFCERLYHVRVLQSFCVSTMWLQLLTSPATSQKLWKCPFYGPPLLHFLYISYFTTSDIFVLTLCALGFFTAFWWAPRTHISTLFSPVGQFWI